MSTEQLSTFFEAVQADAGLEEKLQIAADLDAAVAIAKEAGFDVTKEDWLNCAVEMSDEELGRVAGGISSGEIPTSLLATNGTCGSCWAFGCFQIY